jgi:hypothetical protein
VQAALGPPAVEVRGAPAVRAVVRDQPHRTIVHLLNLNVRRLSSFEDKVTPATGLTVAVRVPLKKVRTVRALTADIGASAGALTFSATAEGRETMVKITLPRLEVAALLVVE